MNQLSNYYCFLLLILLLLCRRYVVFCQTLSANDTNSRLSSQPLPVTSSPHPRTFLQFHHSNRTLISAAVLMLPTLLDSSYFFASDVLPRDFMVSVCQRSELRCVPVILHDSFSSVKLLEFWLLPAVDTHCHTSLIFIMLTHLSNKCFLQVEIKLSKIKSTPLLHTKLCSLC